jgi:general secretion pathway protein E
MSAAMEISRAIDWAYVRTARARGETPTLALATLLGTHERVAAEVLAGHFHLPFLNSDDLDGYIAQFDRLPLAAAQQRRCVLLRESARPSTLRCALSDPFDADLMTLVGSLTDEPVVFCLATPADIHAYLNRHEAQSRAFDSLDGALVETSDAPQSVEVLSLATVSAAASPAIRLVNSTLYDALRAGASDVHLESTAVGLAVKYRIDGVLDSVAQVNGVAFTEHVISRLKVLAQLDIAERRIPQDGSFRVMAQEREIDLRVSIMPSAHGEDAVIRILDKQAMLSEHGQLTLDTLGFDSRALAVIRDLIEAPYGMLLVTGPTGSGKTTTLYAALSETHTGRDKVITIEDPVEYQLPGILQIPVNEKKGLTFARGLRSILRHDPDKIMVGEIRDRETAEIAVQSALTGHLVLSSVHANSVYDVFGRFTHMGLDPYALASALNGVWAQRLLRVNCQSCTKAHSPDREEMARVGLSIDQVSHYRFARGTGCGDCRGTGYRGRVAVAEVLRLTDELRELVVDKQPVRKIKELASRGGTRNLKEASLDLVAAGRTTLEEVRRVTLAS